MSVRTISTFTYVCIIESYMQRTCVEVNFKESKKGYIFRQYQIIGNTNACLFSNIRGNIIMIFFSFKWIGIPLSYFFVYLCVLCDIDSAPVPGDSVNE